MSSDNGGPDLIQRYAERLKQQRQGVSASKDAPPPAASPAATTPPAQTPTPVPPQTVAVATASPVTPTLPPETDAVAPASSATEQAAYSPASPAVHRDQMKVRIDFGRLERLGYIVPDAEEKTLLSEEFRLIKRPLIQKAFATGEDAVHNGNLIMVTSSRPNEGKTFTAVNLALSIASERDLYVTLVDSDVYTQAVLATFGLTAEKGLVDILLDKESDLSDVMLRTNIPNFTIVPAGPKHPNATELLSSQRMARLAEDMASRYPDRIIVIDSPPILASSEPSVLASHVGQVIRVIEQNRTGWRLVEKSLSQIDTCAEISFVINKVEAMLWEEDFASHYRYKTNYWSK